jgi:hypothetical protein
VPGLAVLRHLLTHADNDAHTNAHPDSYADTNAHADIDSRPIA